MDKLDLMMDIKAKTESLRYELMSKDKRIFKEAQKTYAKLFSQFQNETRDRFTSQQFIGAKRDFEHFLVLIDLTIVYHKAKNLKQSR